MTRFAPLAVPERAMRVLHIENEIPVTRIVTDVFKNAGVPIELMTTYPEDPNAAAENWGLPAGADLNAFDFSLLDIELLPTPTHRHIRRQDLQGGSIALPYLRFHAPWLPALAYSRLLDPNLKWWNLPAISGFRFDGLLSRSAINTRELINEPTVDWLQAAEFSRAESAYGPSTFEWNGAEVATIDALGEVEEAASEIDPRWEVLIRRLFPFASRILLTPVQRGWSGAIVLCATVESDSTAASPQSRWLVKMSKNVWNLANEARAHLRLQRGGVAFATSTNLIWRIPISIPRRSEPGRVGAIAYQFSEGTENLLAIAKKGSLPADVVARVGAMVAQIYVAPRGDLRFVRDHLRDWLPDNERLLETAELLPAESGTRLILSALARRSPNELLDRQVRVQRTLIHGDLHLGNIMYGSRDALVDYALSADGPIAVDLGKLMADVLVRVPSTRQGAFEGSRPGGALAESFGELFNQLSLGDADRSLLRTFIGLRLAQYLRHSDVDAASKEWIRSFSVQA